MMVGNERLVYQVPRVVRIGEAFPGPGACDPAGSGDLDCSIGTGASEWCDLGNFGGERP